MNKSHKYAVTVVGASALTPFAAFAAVPASVTTGITDAVADVGTIGAAILGVIIVIAAFGWMRRMVK
ncbi:MAG: major capsid protein [Nitrosomonas sp.]|uniref:major capsid protein n=1 Tax=Nitrosomonas sp. TaxID=42353 RepID=UPI002734ABBD|nr:major capsid protein [Nitrosomonas sp.]MDP3662060.1 major capsid protein [Nitrosomonas sp.]MDZ4106489.1 major capsid protein [Nitrosomonas sp.]